MKTILFTFLCLIFCSALVSQTTAIPDSNFEQALFDLGIDTNGLNGTILDTDAQSVTELIVAEKNISDLTGIEAFTNLTILRCNQNNLTSLNLASHLNLEYLFCQGNDLSVLDLSTNAQLQILYCAQNNLTTLDVTNNLLLNNIVCWDNDLANISFGANTVLYSVSCDENNIINLDVSSLTNLEDLNCGDNPFTTLDLTANTQLLTLSGYGLQLTELDLSNNPNLEELYVNNNQLTTLNLEDKSFLKRLSCQNNQLTSLNVSNGNNANVTLFRTNGNADLNCIEVDNEIYSTDNWDNPISGFSKDDHTNFSEDCAALSIDERNNSSISIYPNPTSNRLYISFDTTVDSILVYNILGDIITKNSNQNYIDLHHLKSGMYVLKIEANNRFITKKVILQ